jgi:hypothetical protein
MSGSSVPCPHCGADVRQGARVCRECGSDAATGWLDEAEIDYQRVDLPSGYRDDAPGDDLAPARLPAWAVVTAWLLAILLTGVALGVFAC